MATKPFKGVIDLDIRKSTPDWEPYTSTRAPEGAPNVLFILYDDTGLATWSPFGGRVNMPTLQKLADKYALCRVVGPFARQSPAITLAKRGFARPNLS